MSVKIAAQFTKERRGDNGLDAIVGDLIKEPGERRFLIAEYHCPRASEEFDEGGVRVPTVALDRIEPVLDAEDVATVEAILKKAYAARSSEAAGNGQADLFSDADED
jgi:hypothetical protein